MNIVGDSTEQERYVMYTGQITLCVCVRACNYTCVYIVGWGVDGKNRCVHRK